MAKQCKAFSRQGRINVFGFFGCAIVALGTLARLAGADEAAVVYVPRAISSILIMPGQSPPPGPLSKDMSVTACPDEYEPASFVIHATRRLENLAVEVGNLADAEKSLPREVVDVRVVKCWYQAGSSARIEKDVRILVPELLLHDDGLVRVDTEKKENFLRDVTDTGETVYVPISTPKSDNLVNIRPKDAKRLLPVTIPAGTSRQFWLTIHVPADAKPGNYKGTIKLRAKNVELPVLNLSVRVLPFKLVPTRGIIGIWYRGKLTVDGKGSIGSEWKSPQQYLADMETLKAHGVLYPTFYQTYNEDLIRQQIQLRQKVGLPKGIYLCCWGAAPSAEAAKKWGHLLTPLG